MSTLGIAIRTYKVYAAWIGEKAGQAAGWRTLLTLAETDHRLNADKVEALISRAERQAELLEEIRRHAADRVIRCRAA